MVKRKRINQEELEYLLAGKSGPEKIYRSYFDTPREGQRGWRLRNGVKEYQEGKDWLTAQQLVKKFGAGLKIIHVEHVMGSLPPYKGRA